MKERERQQEAGTKDAPVVISNSQDASPPSPSLESEPSQGPQKCMENSENSGAGATQSSCSSQPQGSSQSEDSMQPAGADTREAWMSAPSDQKKKRGRKPKNKEQETNAQGKRKKKAVSSVPQGTDRVREGCTVWQRLGVCKCDKCGFTTTEESIFQCHICSSRRITASASPKACAIPVTRTPQASPSSTSTTALNSEPLALATPSPLAVATVYPPAISATQSQPSSQSANQGGASCSAATTSAKMSTSCEPAEEIVESSTGKESKSKPNSVKLAPPQETPASRQGIISYEPSTDQYTCKQCGFVENGIEFIEHLMFQMISNPYYCQYCPKSFAERGSFHKHCASEHPSEKKKCKLRQVSVVKGIMNKAVEEAKEGKPATFNFHAGFCGCVKKAMTQRKASVPSCSQNLTVMPVVACYSNTPTTCQVTTSPSPGASTTVSTAIPSTMSSSSITSVAHSVTLDGASAAGNRDSDTSALPQASEANVTGASSQLNAASSSNLSISAYRPLRDATVLHSPVTNADCVSDPLVLTTASSNSARLENRTLPSTSFRPSVQNSNNEETVENSAPPDAECPLPVIIGYQGNYHDHLEEDVTAADLSASNSSRSIGAHGPFIRAPVVSLAVQSSGTTASSARHAPVTIPVTTTLSFGQLNSVQPSLLSSLRHQTPSQATASPVSLHTGSAPCAGLAQKEKTRSWRFHVRSSPDSPPRYQNIQPAPPVVVNLQRMIQVRAQAASQHYSSLPASQPTGLRQRFPVGGLCTLERPFIQNQFVPVISNPTSAQSAFVHQMPQQGPGNVSVHQNQPSPQTVARRPASSPGVRLQLPRNFQIVQGPPGQNLVRVAGLGSWRPVRVVNLPSEAAPLQRLMVATARASDSTIRTNYSPISPASTSPNPVYTPISPVNTPACPSPPRVSTSVYTPISPVRIPTFPVYTPVSPAANASAGHYSPISPPPHSNPSTDSSNSQPLDLSVIAPSQPLQSVTSLVQRLEFESASTSLATATVTVSTTSVGAVSGAAATTSIDTVPAPSLFSAQPAATISRVKQEETTSVTPREPSWSSTPSTPSVSLPVTSAPSTPSGASQQLVSVESYFIKYRDSYACLLCRKRFHNSEEFYQHVWNHQHTDGHCCSNCNDTDSAVPGQYRCTETARVVGSVSGVLMDVGLLSRLPDECREKLSRRLLQGETGDGASQAASDAAATSHVQQDTSNLPSSSGDATQGASDAQNSSTEVINPAPTESWSANKEREAEDHVTLSAEANTNTVGRQVREEPAQNEAGEGQVREEPGPREGSSAQGNILNSKALGTNAASPHGSTSNMNDKEDQNDDHGGSSPEPESTSEAMELEQPGAGLDTSSTAGIEDCNEECTRGNIEAESSAQEVEKHVQERGEGDSLSAKSHQAVEHTEASETNAPGGLGSGGSEAVSAVPASVQEESGADGDVERGEGISDTQQAAGQDQSSADLSQNDAASGSGDESQEFVLSRDSTPDRSNDAPLPRKEAPVFNRSEVFFICALCEFSCCLAIDFTMHLNSEHHENTAFPCYHCNYQGMYTTDLTNHITAHTTGDSKIYTCPCASTVNCPFRTDSLKSLSNHVQCHPGRPFWCTKCESEFADDTELLVHLTSNSMTLYSCSQCPSRFLEKAAIQRHWQAQHNGGLVFRVVKMLLCKERKDNGYSPPECPLPIRRPSAEEEASGNHQDSPARRASAPGCGTASEPIPVDTPVVGAVCPEKSGSMLEPVPSSSKDASNDEESCPEAIQASHPALESSPPSRPSEEDEASNPEAILHAATECSAAASVDEQSSTDNVNTPASSSMAVESNPALVNTAVEKPESPSASSCRRPAAKSKLTSPLSISKEKVGKIRQLISQIKLPVKIVISAEGKGEEQKGCDLPVCTKNSGGPVDASDNSVSSTLAETELEAMASLNRTAGVNAKVEDGQASTKTEETVPLGTAQDSAAVVSDDMPRIFSTTVEAERSAASLETAGSEESVAASRDQVPSSADFPAQPEDMVPLKNLLGTDELHNLLLNTLCCERVNEQRFICSICEIGFDERRCAHEHLFGHFRMPFIMCALCPFGCSSRPEFVSHFGTEHPGKKKVCKYLMVPRSNPLRQLTNDGPLTVEEFREFCRSFGCGESNVCQNTSSLSSQNTSSLVSQITMSQSLPQDESISHSIVRERNIDPQAPPGEQNHLHDSPSPSATHGTEPTTAVTDDKKRGGAHSAEETRTACAVRQLEMRRNSAGDAGKSIGAKEPSKCGVRSSTSSIIAHRRNSGQGCSRDLNLEESSTDPESTSDEHARPAALKSKKPVSCESPARPKPGTYTMVKHGACSKPKCLSCGNMTLSLAAMSHHLKACSRYINSERDSEHISKAGSLAKKMKSTSGGHLEGSALFTASDSEHTMMKTSNENCTQQSHSKGGASPTAWDPKDVATGMKSPASLMKKKQPWNRPGPLSSKLASLQQCKLGAGDKQDAPIELLEMLPQLSGVKRRLNKNTDSDTRVPEKSSMDLDNTSSDVGDHKSRDNVEKDDQKDSGSKDSGTRSLQSNPCEPEKGAVSELEEEERGNKEKRKNIKKSARIILSSNEEGNSDAQVAEPVTEVSEAVATVLDTVTNVSETIAEVPQTVTEVSETVTDVSETMTEVPVPSQREPADAEKIAESKEKSECIFKCKLCDFRAPECQRLELETHLQGKHPHLLQIAKCGHCNYIYNSSKADYLRNHTKNCHPGMEERKEDLPLKDSYISELKENLSPKPDQEERLAAKSKEPPVKRKNTAKRTGPKVGTEEAELSAAELSGKKSAEMLQKASTSGRPQVETADSDSTGVRSGIAEPRRSTSLDTGEGEMSGLASTVSSKPATQRAENTERSVWSAVGVLESGIAATELENQAFRSSWEKETAPASSSASEPQGTAKSTELEPTTSQAGSASHPKEFSAVEDVRSGLADGKSLTKPQNASKSAGSTPDTAIARPEQALQKPVVDTRTTTSPARPSSSEDAVKKSSVKPQRSKESSREKAGASQTGSTQSELGSKKSVLKPQNTATEKVANSQAVSAMSKPGSKESLLKPHSKASPAGPHSSTNKGSVDQRSSKHMNSSVKQRELDQGGTDKPASQPATKGRKICKTSSEDESHFQTGRAGTLKRKRESSEETVKRDAVKQTHLGEGSESDASHSSDEDFSIEKHIQQAKRDKIKTFSFLNSDNTLRSNRKPVKKLKTNHPPRSLAEKTSEARPTSSSSGFKVAADAAVSQNGANAKPSKPSASMGSTNGQPSGQRRTMGAAKAKNYGYVCVMCDQRHMELKKIKAHLVRHIDYRTIPCCCCRMEFMDVNEAKQHHKIKHPDSAYNRTVSRDPKVEMTLNKLIEDCLEKAQNEAAGLAAEESQDDASLAWEKSQTVVWKQSIQCRLCQTLHDSINEFKNHWEDKHEGSREKMEWVDVKSQGVYNLKGNLLKEGPSSLSLQHKYLCAFCPFRAIQRELVTEHKKKHPDMNWQWTVMLQTVLPVGPGTPNPQPKVPKPAWAQSASTSASNTSSSPSTSATPNPASTRQKSRRGEGSANMTENAGASQSQAAEGETAQGDGESHPNKARLKGKGRKARDPKLEKAMVLLKDLLNGHDQEEISRLCHSYGITSICFDRKDRGSKHKKLLEPGNTS